MAVGAQEDALPGLSAKGLEALAAHCVDREGLRRRVDVVEVEVQRAPAVAAEGAAAAGLPEQDRPHLAMAARDRLAHTALAPPAAAALVEVKRNHAMTRAAPQLGRALAGWTTNVSDTAIGLLHEHMFACVPDV